VNCLVDDIVAGKQEISLVADVLMDCSTSEKEEAWARLQNALAATGIAPQLSSENLGLIMSTLQNFNEGDALSIAEEQTAPTDRISASMEPTPVQLNPRESLDDKDWLADEPTGLPFLPLPPKGLSYSDRPRSYPEQAQPYPEKEAILEEDFSIPVLTETEDSTNTKENFPIPTLMEIQDITDTQKEALPTQPSENFPIPVLTETQPSENFPIPVLTEHPSQSSLEEYRDANLPIPTTIPPSPSPSPPKPDLTPFKVPTNPKKPHRITRLLWELTNSKESFITSIIAGNHTSVQSHLLKGASPNIQNTTSQTPLMAAVSFNHESITRLLLSHGADSNTRSLSGETALSAAASRGYDRLVRTLLASGADPNAGRNTGKMALALAAAYGQDRIVALLLDCGANVNGLGGKGETALAAAAVNGNMRVAGLLLEYGAGVDVRGFRPAQTPLWKAVTVGDLGMVRLLLVWGADPFGKVGRETVMEYAGRLGRGEVVALFAEFGFYPLVRFQYC
jgi:ankyrin repeat protein